MKRVLDTTERIAVRAAFTVLLVAVWLLLNAWLDGQPNEADALQASADIDASLAAMHAAAKGPQ